MGALSTHLVEQLVFLPILIFIALGSLLGVAIGAGLIASSARTLRFVESMNRWVSTRRFADPLDSTRDFDSKVKRHPAVFGAVFAAAGAYALYVLVGMPGATRLGAILSSRSMHPALVSGLVEVLRWLLTLGSAVAIAVGLMLVFAPRLLQSLEQRTNRWVSTESIADSGDTMHTPLDRLVAGHPRAAGGVILAFSLFVVIDFAILFGGRL